MKLSYMKRTYMKLTDMKLTDMKQIDSLPGLLTPIAAAVMALAFTVSASAQSDAVPRQVAKTVAKALHADAANLKLVKKAVPNKELEIYGAEGGGFAILSASDNRLIGYSTEGDWDFENMSPALKEMIANYSNREGVKSREERFVGKLLLTANYNQGFPYNSGIGDGSVVGCIGTALSIIMQYHQWPDIGGIGTKEYSYYYYEGDEKIVTTQSYDYSRPFDWGNILDSYNEDGQYTQEQIDAIGQLCYAAAVAAETIFDRDGSMGFTYCIPDVLWNNLCYDVGGKNEYKMYYENEDWEASVRSQIDEDLPVFYAGGAHAFVVDGYDESGLFHINWGWGGHFNGYFDLEMLSPSPGDNYSAFEEAMFWIRPRIDKSVPHVTMSAYSNDLYSGSIRSNRGRVVKNQSVLLTNFIIRCYDAPGDMTVGVALCDKDSNIREIVKTGNYKQETLTGLSYGFQAEERATFSVDAEEGDYLRIVYKFTGMDWELMPTRAHIENRCPAYGYEVEGVKVSWTGEDNFDIKMSGDSQKDFFALGDYWSASVTPLDPTSSFNVKINGETHPQGVSIGRYDDVMIITVNYSTGYKRDTMEIELISIPAEELVKVPIKIYNPEAGSLGARVAEMLEPKVITNLVIEGEMDESDFGFIRNELLTLSKLDVSEVRIKGIDCWPYWPDDYIPEYAFADMVWLKSVALPSQLKGIANFAFRNCGVSDFYIPSGVTFIGGNAFLNCKNLKTFTIACKVPPRKNLGDLFSTYCVSDATLIVPAGAKEAYLADPEWNKFGTIIEDENVVDAVYEVTAEQQMPFRIEDGCVRSKDVCRVYDMFGRLVGEGVAVSLPDRGIYIVCVGGTSVKIRL